MSIRDILESANKQYVYCYNVTDECQLCHTDILVLSYLLLKRKYDCRCTAKLISKRTGLGEETVARSVERLEELGLVVDGLANIPPDKQGWFRGETGYMNWIRSECSKLTVIQHSLFSYLVHCVHTGYHPNFGFTVAYLVKVLKSNRDTIKVALTELERWGFVKSEGSQYFLYKGLWEEQLAFFCTKDQSAKPVGFGLGQLEEMPPMAAQQSISEIFLPPTPLQKEITQILLTEYGTDSISQAQNVLTWINANTTISGTTREKILAWAEDKYGEDTNEETKNNQTH